MENQSLWSRTKISTLSNLLLIMMVMAGVFFTTAFSLIQSDTQNIHQHWQAYLAAPDQAAAEQHAEAVEQSLVEVNRLTQYFIFAVLLAVIAFLALMYATLIHKISRPLRAMQKGITGITQSNDFATRLDVKYNDEVGQVLQSFNHLTLNLKTIFDETNRQLQKVADGEFDQQVEVEAQGDLLRFTDNVNASIHSVAATMHSLEQVAEAISAGDFSVRMDESVKGELKQKVDHAMISMDRIIEEINHVMYQVSNCELKARVNAPAQGRMQELKAYVNNALETLEQGLSTINGAIQHLSERDLTQQIALQFSGEMEVVKHQLNHSSQQLNSTLLKVNDTASQVKQDVSLISESNRDLAQRTQTQAAAIEQSARAMQQMTDSVSQAADNAMRATQVTEDTRRRADEGAKIMSNSVHAMQQIQSSSLRISDIVNLIDSIAFQTNLLALNAAVEAARAGEHGRGFAVVAGEVRSLAQKSSDAAREIRKLIDEVVSEIENGASQLGKSSEAFERINQGVQTVNDIVAEISASSREQNKDIRQVSQTISELDSGIQKNRQVAEETSEHSSQMVQHTHELIAEVQRFKLDKRGSTNAEDAERNSALLSEKSL